MESREITLWTDTRWCSALEAANGKSLTEQMQEQLNALIRTLPQEVQNSINAEIRREGEQRAREAEADRRFSSMRVTEGGDTHIWFCERGEDTFTVARNLRRYLRGEGPICQGGTELTVEKMERIVAEAVCGSKRVVGVYDIDMETGEFSLLDGQEGWQTFRIKDISAAAYFACKRESADWGTKRDNFKRRLSGMEALPNKRPVFIRGTKPLPVYDLCFEGEISQMDHLLNFYIPIYFDPGAVLGTHIGTTENDDHLNVYANYDMEQGCVSRELEVYLVRGDGSELPCQYRLTPEERAALLPKMDAYCKQDMGITLESARAQYRSQEMPPQTGPIMG